MEFDEFGPEKVVEVYDPRVGMHGFLVIDNTGFGPGKGGIRMTPTVSKQEVAKLARVMTWKTAIMELPFGGAKSGIVADPRRMQPKKKDEIVRSFARALKDLVPEEYIAAPDMNMAEREMTIFAKENGRKSCTGKPKSMGGLPHELGSTGFGTYHAALVAMDHLGMDPGSTTVAIEGFGNVGTFVAKFLSEKGATLVAVSDSKGVIYNPRGMDFKKLMTVKKKTGRVKDYKPGKVLHNEEIMTVSADVLVTAAIPDLITPKDVPHVKAKLIVEGSNIAMAHQTEEMLMRRGILVVPDFVANAGGVISSYVEYKGGTAKTMFKMVEDKIRRNTKVVLEKTGEHKGCPRCAALEIAQERVHEVCKICK
jgi:glutamate dehydrogenase (NAD(P)+)